MERSAPAAGCFWLMEASSDGTASVENGNTGGKAAGFDYKTVRNGTTNHAEAVRITFHFRSVNYAEIPEIFFEISDKTPLRWQGINVGNQCRSMIFPESLEHEAAGRAAISVAQAEHNHSMITIEPLSDWSGADDCHQEYFEREQASKPYSQVGVGPKFAYFKTIHTERLSVLSASAS
jgi:peptide-methionine (S)-S-oxide reductase